MINYVILTNGRAGSSLLNSYLRQMKAGNPQSWIEFYFKSDVEHTAEGLQALLETKRVDGILGIKVSWHYLWRLYNEFGITTRTFFQECMPNAKVIYLGRRNKIQQGLSRVKHDLLDRSHVLSEDEMESYKEAEKKKFDEMEVPVKEIHAKVMQYVIANAGWEYLFESLNISPLRIYFEDFVRNKAATCQTILDFIGVAVDAVNIVDRYLSTHSDVNDKWHDAILGSNLEIL